MLFGPVGSPYPGKYFSFEMAAVCAMVAWNALKSAVRIMRERRDNAAQGITYKPDSKKSIGAAAIVALMATFTLVTLLVAIYKSWPA